MGDKKNVMIPKYIGYANDVSFRGTLNYNKDKETIWQTRKA